MTCVLAIDKGQTIPECGISKSPHFINNYILAGENFQQTERSGAMSYITRSIDKNICNVINYQNELKKEISKFNQKIKLTEIKPYLYKVDLRNLRKTELTSR